MPPLLQAISEALAPDGVDLQFFFVPEQIHYRCRCTQDRLEMAHPVRQPPALVPSDFVLTVPFGYPDLLDGHFSLSRKRGRPWTDPERVRFRLLTPFIQLVLVLCARLEVEIRARSVLGAALEQSPAAVLILDSSGSILFANALADTLLSRQTEEGLSVLGEDGRPAPLLSVLLGLAPSESPSAKTPLVLTDGTAFEVRAANLRKTGTKDQPPFAHVVALTERDSLSPEDLKVYLSSRGITGREAQVVDGVLRGLKNAEIARELFICEYTVKDHLKHVFGKLSVSSRGGLIRSLRVLSSLEPGSRNP